MEATTEITEQITTSNAYTAAQDAGILGGWTLWAIGGVALLLAIGVYLFGRRVA
ncbi:MAG: hypothetical protein AAB573_04510 [Patescibacteria group bacterium]